LTADQYVESILTKYEVPRGASSPAERLGAAVAGPIRTWAGQQLNTLEYSGSYAKQTGVRGTSDVDVFISLKSDTTEKLKDIYAGLFGLARDQGWSPRMRNVSVGVTVNGTRGDLVPGKAQSGYQNYHSLYFQKRDSWTQTNLALHLKTVLSSGRLREIRAVKIWRFIHKLDWPSLYLELFTIKMLTAHSRNTLGDNVLHVLRAIGTSLTSTRIEDPANTSNVLSDEISANEKQRIASVAIHSAMEPYWEQIIW
jgi:hypothetical protein